MGFFLTVAAAVANFAAAALWFFAIPPKYTRHGVMFDLPTGEETPYDRGVRLANLRNRAAAATTGMAALLSGLAVLADRM